LKIFSQQRRWSPPIGYFIGTPTVNDSVDIDTAKSVVAEAMRLNKSALREAVLNPLKGKSTAS